MKIRISARQSDLARLQAYRVGEALKKNHPTVQIIYAFRESLGDKNLEAPLWKIPEKGVFTEDFVADLQNNATDLVVHSWKDLPVENKPGLEIMATLPRADLHDILLFKKSSLHQKNIELFTSSPRRIYSAQKFLPRLLPFTAEKIQFTPIRGNIPTRLKKFHQSAGDGLFLAKAALDRLLSASEPEFLPAQETIRTVLADCLFMVLPLSYFPTAPAQGALAIEARSDRSDLRSLLEKIHCPQTARLVEAERAQFAQYGGGCHQKIGLNKIMHPKLGELSYFVGQMDSGEEKHEICASVTSPTGTKWPQAPVSFFAREMIEEIKNPGTDLFVTKDFALPQSWNLDCVNTCEPSGGKTPGPFLGQVIWSAGLATWEKLAKRGLWVSGSCESLGEDLPQLNPVLGRSANWTKLTHEESANTEHLPQLATYRLKKIPMEIPLADEYFWSSESAFLRARELNPSIHAANHSAGAGYSAAAIEKHLGKKIKVYLNFQHWKTGKAL